MSPNQSGESAFIAWLRKQTPAASRVLIGPGDDAASVAWPAGAPCLVTTDMLLEGSCFVLEGSPIQVHGVAPADPARVGRKAMAVNLSDIAAMAGRPVAAVVAVGLPRRGGRALAEALYQGMRQRADEFDTPIVGGDTNTWDGPLVLSITVFGEPGPGGVVRRDGARPGDLLVVTGSLGGSILGKHLDFTPRIREAQQLASLTHLRAMMDLSDGLAADLPKLCAESACGAVVWADAVPISDDARRMPDKKTPLEHALGDGEDFELLFAVPAAVARQLASAQPIPGIRLSVIGECIEPPGLWLEVAGRRTPLPALGWEHALE